MTSNRRAIDVFTARDIPPVVAHPDIACRNVSPEIFYPGKGRTSTQAKAVCRRCPHRRECLDWALATEQTHGVWGGTDPLERLKLLKNRKATA